MITAHVYIKGQPKPQVFSLDSEDTVDEVLVPVVTQALESKGLVFGEKTGGLIPLERVDPTLAIKALLLFSCVSCQYIVGMNEGVLEGVGWVMLFDGEGPNIEESGLSEFIASLMMEDEDA